MAPKEKTVSEQLRENVEKELNQDILIEELKKQEDEWNKMNPGITEGERWVLAKEKIRGKKIRKKEGD